MNASKALDLITMLPLMAAERPTSDIGRPYTISSEPRPAGGKSMRRLRVFRCPAKAEDDRR